MTKKILIERLLRERDKFELLLNRVGYTRRMTLTGVSGKWSIKDILAHILSYEQYMADRMHEILHHEVYVPCKTQTALDAFLDQFGYPDFGSPLLDDDAPNAGDVGDGRAGDAREDDSLHDRDMAQPPAEPADRGVAEAQETLRHRPDIHQLGGEQEQRHGEQHIAVIEAVEKLLGGRSHVETGKP